MSGGRAALVAPYRTDLLASAGEDGDGSHRARLVRADGASREALDGAMTTLLGKVRGAPADHLADVLHAPGAHAAYEGNVAAPGTV